MTEDRGRLGRVPGGGLLRRIWQWHYTHTAVHGDVQISHGLRLGRGTIISSAHGLVIGPNVSIGRNCTIEVAGSIGEKTVLAANVGIVGRNDHAIDEVGVPIIDATWVGDRPQSRSDTVVIGRDVWVGYGAIVLSGCEIGDGSVVAAGSVVVHDVEPFAIVAGNPARKVGVRFDEADGRAHLAKFLEKRSEG